MIPLSPCRYGLLAEEEVDDRTRTLAILEAADVHSFQLGHSKVHIRPLLSSSHLCDEIYILVLWDYMACIPFEGNVLQARTCALP